MCILRGPLKFCTCSKDVDKSKPHWILQTDCIEENIDIKSKIVGTFTSSFQLNLDFVNRLNQGNFFDFEYTPNHNDILTLKISSTESYCFIYKSKTWIAKSPFGYKTLYKHQEEQCGYINDK